MSKPIAMTGSVLMCDKGAAPVPLVASGSASVKICNVPEGQATARRPHYAAGWDSRTPYSAAQAYPAVSES